MMENGVSRHAILDRMLEVDASSGRAKMPESFVACYEHLVPPFVDNALDRLYGSIHSTVGIFRFDGSISSANTYVASIEGEPISVLLYRRERGVVTVLNGSIRISAVEIERFTKTIFERYKGVSAIVFNAIQHDIAALPYPHQRYTYGEDIVAALPETAERYFTRLGKNMRETIKRFQNRLKRNHPDFQFHVYVNDELDENQVRELYKLQRARIATKNKVSTVTDDEIERVIVLAKSRGLVTIATISGKVCGGMVCLRAGDNFFMRAIAHDPAYDDAKLGTLCCYYTLCECIARGGKAFHFSPGRVLYKYRFLGVEERYERVILYRSRMHMLLNAKTALAMAIDGRLREFRLWLLDAKSGDERGSHLVLKLLTAWRAAKSGGSIASRIAAVKAALRPADDQGKGLQPLLSASPEANEEIKSRRRAAPSVNSVTTESTQLQSA